MQTLCRPFNTGREARWIAAIGGSILLIVNVFGVAGCDRYGKERAKITKEGFRLDPQHPHEGNPLGGVLVSFAQDTYHAEAVLASDGVVHIYLLGSDETRLQQVPRQSVTAYVKPIPPDVIPVPHNAAIVFSADPLEGDAEDQTTRLTGVLPSQMIGRALYLTLPGLQIENERFFLRFAIPASNHPAMPVAVPEGQARELYFTAGGKYTLEDIVANGEQTAAERYAGFQASHDPFPNVGDRICPVTQTKANELCSWIVGGETYYFCCPPCIDEFIATAKSRPEDVLAPDQYRRLARGDADQARTKLD